MKKTILWVGRGRLARHLTADWQHVLAATHESLHWNRNQPVAELHQKLKLADIVALAISDRALVEFYETHKSVAPAARWIHFSGALDVPGVTGFHPLMSFGPALYDEATYRQIPYVTRRLSETASTAKENTGAGPAAASSSAVTTPTAGPRAWPADLPLPNLLFEIDAADLPRYHALCVMAGNFTTLLWEKAQREFQLLGLSPHLLRPYADIIIQNVFQDPERALTGPLVRGDTETMRKNLESLAGDPFEGVYRAFQKAVLPEVP